MPNPTATTSTNPSTMAATVRVRRRFGALPLGEEGSGALGAGLLVLGGHGSGTSEES